MQWTFFQCNSDCLLYVATLLVTKSVIWQYLMWGFKQMWLSFDVSNVFQETTQFGLLYWLTKVEAGLFLKSASLLLSYNIYCVPYGWPPHNRDIRHDRCSIGQRDEQNHFLRLYLWFQDGYLHKKGRDR